MATAISRISQSTASRWSTLILCAPTVIVIVLGPFYSRFYSKLNRAPSTTPLNKFAIHIDTIIPNARAGSLWLTAIVDISTHSCVHSTNTHVEGLETCRACARNNFNSCLRGISRYLCDILSERSAPANKERASIYNMNADRYKNVFQWNRCRLCTQL